MLSLLPSVRSASTFLPTFPRRGFAVRAFRGSTLLATAVLCGLCLLPASRKVARPLRLPCIAFRASHPQPRCAFGRRFHSHLSASDRILADLGFALSGQARHGTPPNRVRYPTGCSFASGCSPPRLAATQLPSASYDVTSYGMDFHHTDNALSRTHPPRQSRGTSHGRLGVTVLRTSTAPIAGQSMRCRKPPRTIAGLRLAKSAT
jgi:hypothetical protein